MPEDSRVPIILGRPFLATAQAMIDVFNKKIMLRVGDDEVIFDMDQSIKRSPAEDDECYEVDDLDDAINAEAQELLANDKSDSFLLKAEPNKVKSEQLYSASANEIDEKKPELKILPQHLEYAHLHGDKSFPIIISSKLSKERKILLLQVLDKHKGAIAWKCQTSRESVPSYYTHKILMKDDYKPIIQPQRHLNPKVQDVVKLLDLGLIYPILDSSWVSPIHVVPKKAGMTVVLNDNRFFQILIVPEDQENTTFTYPYGTFSYQRMSFGLCNAPATFQRCVTAIFYDMVEDFMEVFMDDFSVFCKSFDCCLDNLDMMLARCEEINLVLNGKNVLFLW
ncbi:DNA-directed DNA polymerase [Tanacetum coccineum]